MGEELVRDMTKAELARTLRITAHRLRLEARHGQTGGAAVECGVIDALSAFCKHFTDALGEHQ